MAFPFHRIQVLALADRSAEVLASLLVLALGFGAAAASAAEKPAANPSAGRAAYEQSCARCHGVQGAGDGVDAKRFYPRPRDFSMGVYKFRTTTSGTPPRTRVRSARTASVRCITLRAVGGLEGGWLEQGGRRQP